MSLLKGTIAVEASDRFTIDQIKQHSFFEGLEWSAVENIELEMPEVHLKEPDSANFEDITYDSADEDWQHEFEEDDEDYEKLGNSNRNLYGEGVVRITEK